VLLFPSCVCGDNPGELRDRPFMHVFVYKSQRKADTYLYLLARDGFDVVPPAVREPLGELLPVLEFDLVEGRRLARADPQVVRTNLTERGFHLQFPPTMPDPMVDG
jgi:uncharacterized protein YcgL (UPF0745 family)